MFDCWKHIGKNCMEWKLDGLKRWGGGASEWKGMQLLKEYQHSSKEDLAATPAEFTGDAR
ncbi:hypothetical protein CDL15_Pgr024067 [Punica granatum]|uniref:Uncharacterized protein n=1 Tax=Punica granatum TaxID=22663 RepID=A0A218XYG4_PUNGR|nr:hypothetical protein CDL15_Pgr024067 [Punica granatum]